MIQISEKAGDKIKELITQQEASDLFLRVGVQAGGCSGFSYSMGLDSELSESDKAFELHGVKVVVDEESSKYLYGVEIDYKDSGMSGGFTIDNPNAIATCGCGSSFRTRSDAGKAEKCDD